MLRFERIIQSGFRRKIEQLPCCHSFDLLRGHKWTCMPHRQSMVGEKLRTSRHLKTQNSCLSSSGEPELSQYRPLQQTWPQTQSHDIQRLILPSPSISFHLLPSFRLSTGPPDHSSRLAAPRKDTPTFTPSSSLRRSFFAYACAAGAAPRRSGSGTSSCCNTGANWSPSPPGEVGPDRSKPETGCAETGTRW